MLLISYEVNQNENRFWGIVDEMVTVVAAKLVDRCDLLLEAGILDKSSSP